MHTTTEDCPACRGKQPNMHLHTCQKYTPYPVLQHHLEKRAKRIQELEIINEQLSIELEQYKQKQND